MDLKLQNATLGITYFASEITGVRAERLNDISRADAVNEGIETLMVDCSRDGLKTAYKDYTSHNNAITRNNPIDSFRTLWESVNGADSWDKTHGCG